MKRALYLSTAAVATLFVAGNAAAQNFSIESAVLDSRTSQNLGVTTERGQIAEFFKAQKAMTFGILRSAGISLDQLSPEVRARIERFQTTNLDAFRAFSQGLDLKDQGRYQEAKEAFRRAAELDPGFALAAEQQQAMPDVTVGSALQLRAVVAAAATTAVDKGKATYPIDVGRALAALSQGQSVVVVNTTSPDTVDKTIKSEDYSVNSPGKLTQNLPNLVAGLSYTTTTAGVSLAFSSEYPTGKYVASGDRLDKLVSADGNFVASVNGAQVNNTAGVTLSDGTRVSWGTWNSSAGAAASLTSNNQPLTPAVPDPISYVMGTATQQMPTSGTATFSPVANAGTFGAPSGTITVDFLHRGLSFSDLGFTLGAFTFSGLAGSTSYSSQVASGAFTGAYTAGSCSGCSSFVAQQGSYSGNFVGKNANGMIFSTTLPTGAGAVSGVHLFGQPGP